MRCPSLTRGAHSHTSHLSPIQPCARDIQKRFRPWLAAARVTSGSCSVRTVGPLGAGSAGEGHAQLMGAREECGREAACWDGKQVALAFSPERKSRDGRRDKLE